MQNRYPIDADQILPEYPRPQMVRSSYFSLNGIWECAIADDPSLPDLYPYSIVVPFSPETKLSGLEKRVGVDQTISYRRTFTIPLDSGKRTILHFEAVDHFCIVYLNGMCIGSHRGGYLPFSFDISDAVKQENELIVQVQDPCDSQSIIRGKQARTASGIFYSGQSGIYQSVWLEQVSQHYIKRLIIASNLEQRCWHVTVEADEDGLEVVISYLDGKRKVKGLSGQRLHCQVDEVHPWLPEDPYLYPFTVTLGEDVVESYVGIRSFCVEDGKLCLNGKPYYHHGILDQGYWPYSLYTPPTDQAMIDDLLLIKKLGFNMVRKHAKVENLRWYHHCDRLGLLVWQDMVSGGRKPFQPIMSGPLFLKGFSVPDSCYTLLGSQDEQYRKDFEEQLTQMIQTLSNCTSIAMWVIFNEGWGQFDTQRMLSLVQSLDGSRTIDPTSGWYDQKIGSFSSRHVYFKAYRHTPDPLGRVVILSEFGGYAYREDGHDDQTKIFGYKKFTDRKTFADAFFDLYADQVVPAKKKGLAASVYTQFSDVQQELNGLVTFDRLSVKVDEVVALQVAALLLGTQE
ncbi:glycoside hydrolase family 2 protein [Sphaerochaeta sp. UBA5836]|uniref:glycoside hydrolase family 2 protein n=2 Tax=unclassified Sphaerochaeta TaxID=2637943 RepID=UPI0025F45590|nr:glycoside hydrolase family 2 TIM barrel-domain containing protein [Sphaerochaeta sp. UBA5836]